MENLSNKKYFKDVMGAFFMQYLHVNKVLAIAPAKSVRK
jgi:hypothetical protein